MSAGRSSNPPEFRYGTGGAKLQDDPTVTHTGKDVPGFLNRYAAAGVEEDKAEVFAHLMVEPKAMADRAKTDKYMRAKVERMKELLATFAPKVDKKFWDAVAKAERKEVVKRRKAWSQVRLAVQAGLSPVRKVSHREDYR